MSARKKTEKQAAEDMAAISRAFLCFLTTLVRVGIENLEAERAAKGRAGPGLFDRKGAAEYLAIGTTTLDDFVKSGEIKRITINGVPKYPRVELDQFIKKQDHT